MLAILGPDSKEIISSGDAAQDKATVDAFVAAYAVMHRWRKMPDGSPNSADRSRQFYLSDPAEEECCRPVVFRHGCRKG